MPKASGKVTNINRKKRDDGDKYLVVSIGGTKYMVWDEKLFPEFKEGEKVKVQFEERESKGNTFLNIQKANKATDSSAKSSSHKELRIHALNAAATFGQGKDGISSDDVMKVARKFLNDFLLGE